VTSPRESLVRRLARLVGGGPRRPADVETLAAAKAAIEREHGPWTAHNAQLAPGLWTIRPQSVNFDEKTRRCLRIVTDFFGSRLNGLRVLDLGAGEGGLSLELAAHGARVVCVEGRRANIAKAEFAAAALGLAIDFRQQDVRDLRTDERFDVVLCFGLLYHLDAASAVALLRAIGTVCERLFVLDTHFSTHPTETVSIDGLACRGHHFREHAPETTAEEKASRAWASLDNPASFWFSKPSLLNLVGGGGFNTVYEVAHPLVFDFWNRATEQRYRYRDRLTVVGVRSAEAPMLTSPAVSTVAPRPVPEDLDALLVDFPPPASDPP
jgi:SAM-dependent methyltransferase